LTNPSGIILHVNASLAQIHWDFGTKWRTTGADSIFQYDSGLSHADYQESNFTPSLSEPDLSAIPTHVIDLCKFSKNCLYDYVNSGGSIEFANQTLRAEEQFEELVEMIDTVLITCDAPLSPSTNHTTQFHNVLIDSNLVLKCDKDFMAKGDTGFTCKLFH